MSNFTMPVSLYMSAPIHAIVSGDTLQSAYRHLREFAVSSLAVLDDKGLLSGVISRTDLLRVGRYQAGSRRDAGLLTLPDRAVDDLMTRDVLTVAPNDGVDVACQAMIRRGVHRVFVTNKGVVEGVFSTREVMQAIADKRLNTPIGDCMSKPLFTIRAQEPISLATERLEKARITGLVVVEDDWPVGVFTQVEALASRDMPRQTAVEVAMNAAIICMPIDTRMFRAAQQALAMRVRRIIVSKKRDMEGIVTGIDFARATL
ncbi:MAG: CBS domain-containing protein [Proteobacteria bacterium]|nr:CBS domain-containing protein [Pseudomonadota bacterium]